MIINAIKREGWFNNDLQFHAIERQTKHIDKLSNQKSLRGIGKAYLRRLTNGGPGTYSGVFPREMATGAAVWGGGKIRSLSSRDLSTPTQTPMLSAAHSRATARTRDEGESIPDRY